MSKVGLWTEEFIWHKKNSYPGKWPNRFRDSWERLSAIQQMQKRFDMYQEEVMIPVGNWAKARLNNLSETDKIRDESKVQEWIWQEHIKLGWSRDGVPDKCRYTWRRRPANKGHSAAVSHVNFRSGSSSCSQLPGEIVCLIHLPAPEQPYLSRLRCSVKRHRHRNRARIC